MASVAGEGVKSKRQLIQELERLKEKEAALQSAEQKHLQAESELQRVNRALSTVSACQKVLVRSQDKSELFQEICRVIFQVFNGVFSAGYGID